ncbi:MAG: hypothetical protein RLY87_779 [Chloroflexota bacterium]|jgi:hypothetical protein
MARTIVLLLVELAFFLPLAYGILMTWFASAPQQSK